MATRLLLAFRQAELDRWTMLHDAAKAVVAEERFWMALLIIAVIVLTAFLAAWMLELSRPETSAGPARDHSRRALLPTVVAALACAAIAGVAIVLISATPNPPVTIAWTGIRAPAPAVPLEIGGGEHRAVTAWPGGGTWPSVRIESPHPQHCLVTTRGGYGFVRSGKVYFNGVAIREGSAPQELAPFWIDVADGHLRIRTGAQLPPLLSVELTEPNERWARSLGQLLALSLYDLRSRGAVRLEVLNSLERWASSIRVIVIDEKTIQVLAPNQTPAPAARLDWTSEGGVFQAPLEIVWPGKRLIGRLALHDGAVQLTFEPPWETASPLPPFEQGQATLTFTRVPRLGTNSFILPLGEPAGDFVHATELQQTDEGALFIAGANPIPKKSEDGGLPSWVRRIGQRPSRMAEARRSTLSSEEIPITVGRRVRAVLTMTIAKAGPVAGAVALALSVAWVLFVLAFCALWAGHAHLFRVRDLWVLACVLVAAWALLAVRLLLAVRYVLDPRAVDDVTVKGLASSLGGLVMLPLFVSLAALLWAQFASEVQGKRRGRWRVIAIAAMAAGGTAFEYLLMPGRVLPVLPERYQPAWSDPLMLAAFGIALLAIGAPRLASWGWMLPYRIVTGTSRSFWTAVSSIQTAVANAPARSSIQAAWKALRESKLSRVLVLWGVAALAILLSTYFFGEYARQIAGPFWLIGLPTLLLVAAPIAVRKNTAAGMPPPSTAALISVVLIVAFLPAAIALVVLDDVGAIYSVVAFQLPLALLLLLTPLARLGRVFIMAIVAGVALAYAGVLAAYSVAPGRAEHILGRVEVMKRGQAAQEWLLDLDAPTSGDSSAVSAAGVRNALVHDWEHMAMTAKGGTLGLGYGRAPATQSFIRQDTIQYDSVFSFFIAGEHGMLGGAALLLIYLAPVAVLLARRNERFHIGDVVAVLIACMLAGEAFAHAAMNTSQLWFSGRNLPLLATASPSDLMRWTLLLGLGAQALLWSRRREGSGEMDSEPFFTERAVYDETYGRPRRRAIRLALIGAVIIAPVLLAVITGALGWMVVALAVPLAILLVKDRAPAIMVLPVAVVAVLLGYGWWRARSSPEYETFTWSRLLSRVDRYSQEGLLRFDPTRHLLQFNGGDGFTARPRGRSLIEAEVLRFNAMPAADRLAGDRASLDASFARLRSPADYQNAVRALWAQECERPLQRRPALFTVERLPHDEDDPRATFRVTGNPRFNVVHSFHDPLEKGDIATVSIGEGAQAVTLIGPAWVMGRWTHATSPDAERLGLGWMRHLGATLGQMPAERRRLIRRLTLDPALQEAATSAVDAAGRSLHQRLLAERAQMPLPPRVALTIMRTTTGETLALGSWPRSSSGRVWSSRRVADGAHPPWTELEPPSTWIDSTAPPAITSRYSGDHNFAALEMGSATKPFWATAALTVHPRLAELLLTRNGTCDSVVDKKCSENQIFGATAGRGWRVPAGERWVGFNNYLALSDNRYQIRLGLLAFARGTADGGIADDGRGPIPSGRESLSGRMQPWDRFPQFGEGMTISRTRPQQITNLHTQPAADAMRDLFGVSTGSHTGAPLRRRRVSFWSGDERDDVRSGQAYDALESVSPDATHLALNRIRETRSLIAILLGGLTNRWSNVHAASAFSSWALGRPIIAHITADATPNALAVRTAKFQAGGADAARRLRPGLRAIFEAGGTANSLLPIIARYREAGYEVYAKTGTLASVDRERPTSRIILTIVRSGDAPDGGVTISFVAERATSGFAVDAVGSFLTAHADLIDRALQPQ